MKNLLIYTNANKEFTGENVALVKIQIDNALDLGWTREDILLYTNFPYKYSGIAAKQVNNRLDVRWDRTSNKILVIRELLSKGLLEDDIYFYHDFDAYQNEAITKEELEMDDYDLAITGYGYKDQMNGGSFFFTIHSLDIFQTWCERTLAICRTRADEKSLTDMVRDGSLKRYKELNITYNFGQRCPRLCYEQADKPLKVLHFHPYYTYYEAKEENIDIFMYGKNPQKIPMMSDRLIKIFHKHGIK